MHPWNFGIIARAYLLNQALAVLFESHVTRVREGSAGPINEGRANKLRSA